MPQPSRNSPHASAPRPWMITGTIFPALHHHLSDPACQAVQTATHHHQPVHSATTAVEAHRTAHVNAMVSLVVVIESSLIVEVHDVVTATTQAHAVHPMMSKLYRTADVKASSFADSEKKHLIGLGSLTKFASKDSGQLFILSQLLTICMGTNLTCHTKLPPCSPQRGHD